MTSLPLEFDDDTGGRPRKKLLLLAGTLLLCFFLGTGVGLVFLAKFGSFPSLESIQEYRPSISSKIYDRYNKVVGEIYLEKRTLVAYRMERKMSKEEILYLYLNQIFLGEGVYGVEAAARTYFGKGVGELGAAEGALLAGLPQAPNRYSPRTNP